MSVELTSRTERVEQRIFGPPLDEVAELLRGYSEVELTVILGFLQRVRGAVAQAGRSNEKT